LDVGDAKGAGLREMLFVPSDRTVGPVDLVLDLLQSVAFSRVADEYSFRADVFQTDEELLGLGDQNALHSPESPENEVRTLSQDRCWT
jgi:hypothetical protein